MTSSARNWGNYLLGILAGAGIATLVLLYIDPPARDLTGLGQARSFTQQTIGMALLLAGILGLKIGRKDVGLSRGPENG